jgi:hypothetical protein
MVLFLEIFFGICYGLVSAGLVLFSGASTIEFWPKRVGRKWTPAAAIFQALVGIAMISAAVVFLSRVIE